MTTVSEALQTALRRRRGESLHLLSRLVAVRSEAGASCEEAQQVVGDYLSAAGYGVRYTVDDPATYADHPDYTAPPPGERPVNLVAIPPEPTTARRLALLAHVDTERAGTGWSDEPLRPISKGGRLYGLGAADDKGGLAAAAVTAAAVLDAGGTAPVVLSVHAKGGGARGTLPVIMGAPDLSAVLYVHPAETGHGLTEIKHATRGIIDFTVSVIGWHGAWQEIGTPESARVSDCGDALVALMRVLDHLRHGALADCDMNVGRVIAGERPGVVPIRAEAAIRASFGASRTGAALLTDVDDDLRQCAHALSCETGTFHIKRGAAMSLAHPASSDWDGPFCRVVREAVREETRVEPVPYGAHLASDLRFPIRLLAIPAVGIGCRAGGFYGCDEWVDIDDLHRLTATLARVAETWNAGENP